MSTGGVFKLLTNTGFQGKVLLATRFLVRRLEQLEKINAAKSPGHPSSWVPTLDQIERSHVLVVNASYKPFVSVGFEYGRVMATGGSPISSSFDFVIPQVGDFFTDMVLHLQLTGLKAKSALDKVRYVAYPGHKIIDKITFKVGNSPLDEITRDDYSAYYNTQVMPHKKRAWDRNVGQEVPYIGHVTPNPTTDEFRLYQSVGTGFQTFKHEQETLDLWIPILMWFKDPKLAFPQLVVPHGQTRLEVSLNAGDNLVSFADYGGGGAFDAPKISKCELYVNNIYLLPEMHSIFINNFGFSLIRVHRRQIKTLARESGRILLNEIKWPVENLYVGFRPQSNLEVSQHWHKNQVITSVNIPVPVIVGAALAINNVVYFEEAPVVDFLELRAEDICIFKETPGQFYKSYLPYQYGKNRVASDDWFMLNFTFTPGEYQPTGYLNVSRARNLYLSYRATSAEGVAAFAAKTDLIVLAECLNFLYVRNASAILKFAT